MLDVTVRFVEKDATVRFLPEQVTLQQILAQYDDTPFDVSLQGAVVTTAASDQLTVRGWSGRLDTTEPAKDNATEQAAAATPGPIELVVEVTPAKGLRLASPPELSLPELPQTGLVLLDDFENPSAETGTGRLVARLKETVALNPGQILVPLEYRISTLDERQAKQEFEGVLQVLLHLAAEDAPAPADSDSVALVDGMLELRLAHLCEQTGCVEHFHQTLHAVNGIGAVRPHPDLKNPAAMVYLRADRAVNVRELQQQLRAESVELVSIVPRDIDDYRLRIELASVRRDEQPPEVQQCLLCRDRIHRVVEELDWATQVQVAAGGIELRPGKPGVELSELLQRIDQCGVAPVAVWLVPDGVDMPKASPSRLVPLVAAAENGGSQVQPRVELALDHSCESSTEPVVFAPVSALLGQQPWAAGAASTPEENLVTARIDNRKYANLTSLLDTLRDHGRIPQQIRLREFGDIRIQLEFAHICGEVEYSKPPKPRKKKDDEPAAEEGDSEPKEDAEPQKKPFVPKPLRPAENSNGRRAIEAAIAGVSWIGEGVFQDYHTQPTFDGPRKLTIVFSPAGEDVVRLDELVDALRAAGFPPKSVIVSRRFSGIPFAKPLPGDLELADHEGTRIPLATLKRPDRPLALAFVSLKCKRHDKYEADAGLYEQLGKTVEAYRDRVDFIAVSANPEDQFEDVVEFWSRTGLAVPLLHDIDGAVRGVLNAQETPAPHLFVFDADGLFRFAGDPHNHWQDSDKQKDDFLGRALELVLAGKYESNGAVFFNKSLCNCSDPNCKCPKCGCGPSCRCTINH